MNVVSRVGLIAFPPQLACISDDFEISEAAYNKDNVRESKQNLSSDKQDERILSGKGK